MIRHYKLDKDRRVVPASIDEWCELFGKKDKERIVKQENIGPYQVSTVFLGIDHSWGKGAPVLWETMVFGNGPMDQNMWRCAGTWEQAEAMHYRAINEVKATM